MLLPFGVSNKIPLSASNLSHVCYTTNLPTLLHLIMLVILYSTLLQDKHLIMLKLHRVALPSFYLYRLQFPQNPLTTSPSSSSYISYPTSPHGFLKVIHFKHINSTEPSPS